MIKSVMPGLITGFCEPYKVNSSVQNSQPNPFLLVPGLITKSSEPPSSDITGILQEIKSTPWKIEEILAKRNIMEQKDLKVITSSLAEKEPQILASHIKDFGITEQEELKTIILTLAEKIPVTLALYIEDFGITDQEFLENIKSTLGTTHSIISSALKNRLIVEEEELLRLTQDPRIKNSLEKIVKSYSQSLSTAEKVAIAQSIELRENLKNEYYVINHGQDATWLIVNILAKKVSELFEGKKYGYFEVLRHDVFLERIPEDRDVNWYKQIMKKTTDMDFHVELLSGDICFENSQHMESAIIFFAGNQSFDSYNWTVSVLNGVKFDPPVVVNRQFERVQIMIEKIAKRYFPTNPELIQSISQTLMTASQGLAGGTLYSICVPKIKFDSVGYVARAFGSSAGMYTSDELDYLQDVTNGELQVRLLTSKLSSEDGIFIVPHSTVSIEQLSKINSIVENCLLNAQKEL